MSDLFTKTAKSHKGRRVLDAKKPKAAEIPRQILLMRGTKISETVRNVLDLFVP